MEKFAYNSCGTVMASMAGLTFATGNFGWGSVFFLLSFLCFLEAQIIGKLNKRK